MSDTFTSVKQSADAAIKAGGRRVKPAPWPSENEELLSHKLTLCVRRTQNQKTFVSIKQMQKELDDDEINGQSIHFVHTMNTLAGGTQFGMRIRNVLKQTIARHGSDAIVIFASKCEIKAFKDQHVKTYDELKGRILDRDTCPRIIIMCGHPTRFTDTGKMLKVIQDNKPVHIKRAFVYYDELHEYIGGSGSDLRLTIEAIHACNIVRGILALSATPYAIWDRSSSFWKHMRIIYLDDVISPNYIGFRDMGFNLEVQDYFVDYRRPSPFDFEALEADVFGFVEHVLEKFPYYLNDGNRVFIPAHIRKSSHEKMISLIFERKANAVVVVLNADHKKLIYKDEHGTQVGWNLDIGDHEGEVGKAIASLVAEHNLGDRPVIVTGLLCIGMGQTFAHQSWGSFTHAIVSHMDLSNDDIYQLLGRLTGMMRTWPTYVKTEIACPKVIEQRFQAMETCAKNIAEECNGTVMNQEMVDAQFAAMGEIGQAVIENQRPVKVVGPKRTRKDYSNCDFKIEPFADIDSLFARLKELDPDARKPALRKNSAGLYVCSIGKESDIQSADAIRTLKGSEYWGQGISNAEIGDFVHRVYVGYEKDGAETFFLRWTIMK